MRKYSPLLSTESLRKVVADQRDQVRLAGSAVGSLAALWENAAKPTFRDVLQNIAQSKLFEVPESLLPFAVATEPALGGDDDEDDAGDVLSAFRDFLKAPFEQVRQYMAYVNRQTGFDTHQGVKGLEFPRVLVAIDDEEARGFMFSYEKLLGVQPPTAKDLENEGAGRESGIDRTRRLFYVTCSRAKSSLAIVARSKNPARVREHALAQGWFDPSEIELLG